MFFSLLHNRSHTNSNIQTNSQIKFASAVDRVHHSVVQADQILHGVMYRSRRNLRKTSPINVDGRILLAANSDNFRTNILALSIAVCPYD